MRNNKKGISPLIATVLLIGFTIVLAALVMRWGSELFQSTTTTQGCTAEARIECATDIDIQLSSTNNSAGTNLEIFVSSNNNKDIKGFWFRGKDKDGASSTFDGTAAFTQKELTPVSAYSTGEFTFTFASDSYLLNTNTVEVIPIIDHVTDEGTQCEMECVDKAKTIRFPWSINN